MRKPLGVGVLGVLFSIAALSCSTRSRVSQAKDVARASGGGDGAATAVRPRRNSETAGRPVGRPPAAAPSQLEAASSAFEVGYAVAFGHSIEARNLPPASPEGEVGEVNELNDEIERQLAVGPGFQNQDATIPSGGVGRSGIRAQSSSALQSISAPVTFEGLADTDNGAGLVNPSDSNGAVGPNHYVEVVNNRVRVYDKSGNPLTPPFRQSSLFASAGGICSTNDNGDPIVLYDKLADRWQVSQFAFTSVTAPPYHQCIAESINGDPTGKYYVYDFQLPGNNFPDYPKLATWPDAYYMSTRQFLNGGSFNGEGAIAFDRTKILAGDPTATLIYFNAGSLSRSSSGMLPSDFDGLLLPPPGTPNIYAIYTAAIFGDTQGNALRLFDFHPDFTTPGNSTFAERTESPIAVADFDPLNPTGRADIEQPPPALTDPAGGFPSDNLDSIGDRLMYRLQYRNRNGLESLVAVHTVNVGVHLTTGFPTHNEYQASPRYYELRRSTPGGAFSVYDQATFAPDPSDGVNGTNRWMGSVAVDNQGNLVVGYSTSSTSLFPSIDFAGRAFDEIGGLLQGETLMFAGAGSQIGSGNRWGDYTSLQLDPVDECTFWFVDEYYPAGDRNTNQFNFHTRVGNFRFSGCTPPARGKITGKVTDCLTGLPIVGALVQASDGHSAATRADGTYSISVPPGPYTVGASDSFRNCNPSATQDVAVSDGGSANADFCLTGNSKLDLGNVALDDSNGNNNGIINRDECIKLTIGISNDGCIADSNISATLSTATPGVTVNQGTSAYPNLVVNTGGNNATPFSFTTGAGFGCGTSIDFTLHVSSDKQAPHDLNFSLPTCAGGAPVPFSGSLASGDATQTARMGRDGNPSACASPKGCPGPLGSGPRLYDTFTFLNNGGSTACLKVDLTAACNPATNPIMSVGYLDTFDPTNLCANYLGDAGGSPNPSASYQVRVPAGHSLVLNVHEISPGLAGCSGYSGQVSGFFDNTPGHPHLKVTSLSPPNHALINVGLGTAPNAVCPVNRQVTVFSDEDDLSSGTIGDMSPDAKDIGFGTLRLRAERNDTGDGRVYLVVVKTTDGTGTAFSCQTVTVANGSNTAAKNSVAAQAAAAQSFCTNNGGAAPAGYFLVGDGPVVGPKQ